MKKYLLLLFAAAECLSSFAQSDTLLPEYNSTFYPTVLSAAKGIAMPFLLQQKYATMTGVTVSDTILIYHSKNYNVYEVYLNPAPEYYVSSSQYSTYGISDFSSIWPTQIPNIMFESADTTFNEVSDCVGYLTRLLSATGNTSTDTNAYLNIINTTLTANIVPFAHRGYVATDYSFAVAFPTFPTTVSAPGWEYISGNVEVDTINTYNHTIVSTLGTYGGVCKGGFAASLPGDLLAFGYSASSSSNGHVMVMEKSPQLLNSDSLAQYFPSATLADAKALLNTNNIYSVSVYDCSGLDAHFKDTRKQMSGIGHGTLLILTAKSDDAPTGFIFDSLEVINSPITIDTLGSSVYAMSVGRFVSVSTGINSISNSDKILVYPNPSTGNIQIEANLPQGDYILSVDNIIGQTAYTHKIHTSGIYTAYLNLSEYGAGVYLLKIQGGNSKVVKKIVVY